MSEEKLPGVTAPPAAPLPRPKLQLVHGVTGQVLTPEPTKERLAKIAAMRDRLDDMARLAHEEGRTDDAAALDAGSFALTFVMKESQQ